MNVLLMSLEIGVIVLGLAVLLGDLWTPAVHKRKLGYAAAAGLLGILIFSIAGWPAAAVTAAPHYTFSGMFVSDGLAIFFKWLFIVAAILVLIMTVEFAPRIEAGISEFYSIVLFALAGMMFAASANDLVLLFVALELITISFYVLNSFLRSRVASLEAGVKYLILGALSTAFTVFGIAFIFGATNTTNFNQIFGAAQVDPSQPLLLLGLLLLLFGLGFKIAAFPFQIWAPDVYQGSPAPATAFLAIGSKAAGFVLLLRVFFIATPAVVANWEYLLIFISAVTILYGNLCAIPQRNVKRLLGYSSIAHAGYLLLGIAALNRAGSSAMLYYLGGYLFTVIAAFTVIAILIRQHDSEDVTVLAGLNQRSPLLAAAMALSMVSLAGIPPLAGFFGKFLLLKAVVEQGSVNPAYYWLVAIAILGVAISIYYYFGVIRAIYWSQNPPDLSPIPISWPARISLLICVGGMLYLGVFPNALVELANRAVAVLHF